MLSGERSRFKRVVSKRLGGNVGGGSKSDKKKRKKLKKQADEENKGEGEGVAVEAVGVVAEGGGGDAVARRGREGGEGEEGSRLAADVQQQEEQPPVLISVGGFKAVDQSVAVTREVADFCRVVGAVKRAAAAAAAGVAAGYGGAAAGVEEEGAGSSLARAGLFEPAFLLILHSLEVSRVDGELVYGEMADLPG